MARAVASCADAAGEDRSARWPPAVPVSPHPTGPTPRCDSARCEGGVRTVSPVGSRAAATQATRISARRDSGGIDRSGERTARAVRHAASQGLPFERLDRIRHAVICIRGALATQSLPQRARWGGTISPCSTLEYRYGTIEWHRAACGGSALRASFSELTRLYATCELPLGRSDGIQFIVPKPATLLSHLIGILSTVSSLIGILTLSNGDSSISAVRHRS